MQFTFLGTGTSAGIPMIGCRCAVCTSQDSRDTRLRASACLRFHDHNGVSRTILIDAGPDLRQQALREGLDRCDAVLFTHNHVDHTFGLDETRRFNAVQRSPIEIYGDDNTIDSLHRVYQHIFDKASNQNDSFVASLLHFRITSEQVAAGGAITLFGVRFVPIALMHGNLPVLGWRVEPPQELLDDRSRDYFPLAYCTDVSEIPSKSRPLLAQLGTLVLDALRHRPHPTHFTLAEAVKTATELGARHTYFIHMAHDLPHQATEESLPPGLHLAFDGLHLPPATAAAPKG